MQALTISLARLLLLPGCPTMNRGMFNSMQTTCKKYSTTNQQFYVPNILRVNIFQLYEYTTYL